MQSADLRTIEDVLSDHPGVRSAAVVVQKSAAGKPGLVAYVVPDDRYVDRTFTVENDETRRTEQWRKIYDLYQKPKAGEPIESGLSVRVWHSAYTKQPIPNDEMQEWVDCALDQVRQFHPTRILEIGCGLGALLLPLAPHCERYVGTDISGATIASLKSRVEASPGKWESVALFERPADHLDDFDEGSFDTVIINSVTMYFPSVEYLTKVLMGAIKVTHPEGTIFIGDIRSLPLLATFAVSVELFQAAPQLSLDELRVRVHKRLKFEKELFISPSYFLALKKIHPEISYVEIRPKRGTFDNEMNRFRYDVVLHLGPSAKTQIEPHWLDWSRNELAFEEIDRMLRQQRPEIIGITGIKNLRIEKDTQALETLSGQDLALSVGSLRDALNSTSRRGVHPERLFSLANETGYQMSFSWAGARSDGSYDVVFCRRDPGNQGALLTVSWPQPASLSYVLSHHVVGPVKIDRGRKLVQQLRDLLVERVEEGLMPVDFVLLDAMPTTSSGEIDRTVVPPAWLSYL
jgi:SAM-dependent methyltransferase